MFQSAGVIRLYSILTEIGTSEEGLWKVLEKAAEKDKPYEVSPHDFFRLSKDVNPRTHMDQVNSTARSCHLVKVMSSLTSPMAGLIFTHTAVGGPRLPNFSTCHNPHSSQELKRIENENVTLRGEKPFAPNRPALLKSLDEAAAAIQKAEKILVLTGAGISVSCGIPDFRSPGGTQFTLMGQTIIIRTDLT